MRTVCVSMSMLKSILLWTIFAVQFPSLFSQVPGEAHLEIGHNFWGFKEGAPEGTEALAQTGDGFLWLGARTGLFRFDGTRFELYRSPFGDQILSTNIYSLFAPPSGGLWVGYTFGGFSFLKDGRITNYGGDTASATGSVMDFAQDKDGIVWAATTSGLWRFNGSQWRHIGSEANVPSGAFADVGFDRDSILWALTGDRNLTAEATVMYLQPGRRQFEIAEGGLKVRGFTWDADGYVVTSPDTRPLFQDARVNAENHPVAYPVLRKGSSQIVDRRGGVWISPVGRGAIQRLRANEQRLSDALAKTSRTNSEVYEVNLNDSPAKLVDREGNIWFGESKGLHRFFYSTLMQQALPKSAKGSSFFTVTPDDDGAVWITAGDFFPSSRFGLYLVAKGQVETRKAPGPLLGFAYRSPDKTVWFGGPAGLWHLVKGILHPVELPKEVADQAIYLQSITQDRAGGMWISFGRHGLYHLGAGVWTSYGGRGDLPKTGVVTEFTDSLGRVWFGFTKSTLAVQDGDRAQVFGANDGVRVGNVTAIYGRGPEIWIGGEFGLQQFDHGRFRTIHATDEEWLRGISGIVETANGDLWLNGLGGVFHLRRAEISKALDSPAYQVKGEHLGQREGFPGLAFQVRPLNTAVEGTDGRLWFATSGGVAWLDPNQAENKVAAPPLTIESVSADEKSYGVGSSLSFPADTSSVQISYAAVSLSDPEAVHFRYKLQETDKDWHEVRAASPVNYRNLAPGMYHFNVNATDTNGVWSDAVSTTEFTILPAFYQTGWFKALCVVTTIVLLYSLYMLRLRQLARQFEARMEERVGERTRIARELHDTLLQSFQAALWKFQVVTYQLSDRPELKRTLEGVIDQARQAVTEARDAVQGLRSSTAVTNDLARAIRLLCAELADQGGSNSPSVRVDVEGTPRDLAPILRDDIYRIAGEAVRNSFQHAHAGSIEVQVQYDHRQLRLRIRDDGEGIDPKVLESGARAGHYGLPGLQERAKMVRGKLRVKSEHGSGTEIELTIPASVVYAASGGRRAILRGKSAS